MKRHRRRYLLAGLLAMIVATVGFAFAATNTVAPSKAGDGSGTVSGYNVTNVSWDLNDTNPQFVDDVTFDLGAAAAEVKARVRQSGGTYYAWASCSVTAGTTYNCSFPASTVQTVEVSELEVASAS